MAIPAFFKALSEAKKYKDAAEGDVSSMASVAGVGKFNPDKRIEPGKEIVISESPQKFDPDKRIDVDNNSNSDNPKDTVKKFDPDKRIEDDNEIKKSDIQENVDSPEKKGLTDEEKLKIKEETNWSDEIIDHIENMDQYEIYKNAGLHEEEINGRKCLVKDIDMDYVDPKTGLTNRERMENGMSPIDSKTGEKIELHHMGQDADSPFAELCENSEHGDGNHATLHPKNGESWRQDPKLKNQYSNMDKPNHWKERSKEV